MIDTIDMVIGGFRSRERLRFHFHVDFRKENGSDWYTLEKS